jgi:hypothetical protein
MGDNKADAELAKLKAEVELIEAQTRKLKAENDQQLQIEIRKSMAETEKIRQETRWYPIVALSVTIAAAIAALGVIVLKLIHG